MNRDVDKFLNDQGIFKTSTEGIYPKANGLAERFVGIIKQRACAYLAHAGVGLRFWYWASLQAAFVYRSAILGVGLPKEGVPTFGNRVLVRKQGENSKSEQSFTSKMDEAVFLCWDSSVINGAYVGCISRLGIFTTRKVSAPTPWPNDTIPTWMLLRNPLGSEKIWLSDKGDISWKTPKAE